MKDLALIILFVSALTITASVPDSVPQGQDKQSRLESILSEMETNEPLPVIQKLTTAADNGDPSSQFMLAVIYDKGIHVKQDKERSSKLIMLSAEGGYPEAMYVVADKYDRERNYPVAFEWYKKAAEAGNSKSMHRLSEMYREGKGTEKNLSLFFDWVKQAANSGVVAAQYDLSIAYLNGNGCRQDFPSSYAWLKIADENGHNKAKEVLLKFRQNMPADDVEAGEKLYLQVRDNIRFEALR